MSPSQPAPTVLAPRQLCEKVCEALWPEAPFEAFWPALEVYLREVQRWGQKIDLVSARSLPELIDLSLADALVLARAETELGQARAYLDVGTGGGAPGLPLAACLAASGQPPSFLFLEPRAKRVAFLRQMLGGMKLSEKGRVLRERSDQLPGICAEVALARATLPPPEWLAEGARLASRSVWVLLARGEAPSLEGFSVDYERSYLWPLTQVERRVVRYSRLGHLPEYLGREAGL